MYKYEHAVVHFGELWLKGRNREAFIRCLVSNIRTSLDGTGASIERMRDRLMVNVAEPAGMDEVLSRLGHVFGISWYAPVAIARRNADDAIAMAARLVDKGAKIRLEAHRSDKSVPFTSKDLVGEFLRRKNELQFTLDKDAKDTLFIEVTREGMLMHTQHIAGLGGLPVRVSGKAVVLMSGGIDSPVAAFYAMRRGLEPIYLHFHAFQSNDDVKGTKIPLILDILERYGPARTYYAPAHVFQSIAMKLPQKFELVLFKKFMLAVAERVALKEHAVAIVTGESLGQVASQTVKNLTASERSTKMFIMRPLIGMDKSEIIGVAKRIGTFELSVQKYRDVCSIRAKNPATGASAEAIGRLYKDSGMTSAVSQTLKRMGGAVRA
ncbi:tRNA 4-thiouridine(8) synthase ThiI [Candidatus Marsarchaeota archaeon]|jgi:thiamine biosynthesis protein ThiI|nr:tRNA 4-thiouridine(8) synthase ThiI [Candidatus Marsarchaeota archaeon]MCL5099699.1 tRNA 4-thiouridine(8) synthase ThiI [Candidatus Marsarchaeota archaeon]